MSAYIKYYHNRTFIRKKNAVFHRNFCKETLFFIGTWTYRQCSVTTRQEQQILDYYSTTEKYIRSKTHSKFKWNCVRVCVKIMSLNNSTIGIL